MANKNQNQNRPNLVYVFADQLRYDALGCNGNPLAQTPHLDALACECLCLDNAVSGHPVCAPYRASLFTGKYTPSTGMVINELRINTNHRAIGHVLTEGGYETCYIGKWHLYANQLGHHYDTKNSYIPAGPDRLGFDDFFAGYNFHHEYYAPKAYYHLNSPEKHYAEGYEPDFMTDFAIEHLKRLSAGQKPFAMFFSLGTPHDPWTKENVPAEYYERFKNVEFKLPENYSAKNDPHADMWARLNKKERAGLTEWMRVYSAMVANLDDNIARFVQAMKELGLWENTIFIFTSDHGEMFGAHGRRAKNIFYEEAIHVPFLMHYGARCGHTDMLVNTVDLMPTLLSMMDLPIPESVQGTDLSECLLEGEGNGAADVGVDGCLLMGTGPTALYANGREWRGWRTKQFTYAVYRVDGQELLFDNLADPLQKHNLAKDPSYADTKVALKNAMLRKMEQIGDQNLSCLEYKRRYVKHRIIQKS